MEVSSNDAIRRWRYQKIFLELGWDAEVLLDDEPTSSRTSTNYGALATKDASNPSWEVGGSNSGGLGGLLSFVSNFSLVTCWQYSNATNQVTK